MSRRLRNLLRKVLLELILLLLLHILRRQILLLLLKQQLFARLCLVQHRLLVRVFKVQMELRSQRRRVRRRVRRVRLYQVDRVLLRHVLRGPQRRLRFSR